MHPLHGGILHHALFPIQTETNHQLPTVDMEEQKISMTMVPSALFSPSAMICEPLQTFIFHDFTARLINLPLRGPRDMCPLA